MSIYVRSRAVLSINKYNGHGFLANKFMGRAVLLIKINRGAVL